jgi:hypothetical protein
LVVFIITFNENRKPLNRSKAVSCCACHRNPNDAWPSGFFLQNEDGWDSRPDLLRARST